MKMIEVMSKDDVCVGWIPDEYLEALEELLELVRDEPITTHDVTKQVLKLDAMSSH